jgi:UPF0271 protein
VIHDADEVVRRAVRMARGDGVAAADGTTVSLRVDTICTHGDTPGAHELTRQLRAGLEREGIAVAPFGSAHA